jgi:hypothetical protein
MREEYEERKEGKKGAMNLRETESDSERDESNREREKMRW